MLVNPFLLDVCLSSIILVCFSGCDTRFKPETVLSGYVTDLNVSSPALFLPSHCNANELACIRDRQTSVYQFDIGLLDFYLLCIVMLVMVAG